MKRILAVAMTIALASLVLTACGQSGSNGSASASSAASASAGAASASAASASAAASAFDPAKLKTMGDAFAYADSDSVQEGYSETKYAFVFGVDGTYYRVVADMPKDVSEAIWAVDSSDENGDQKVKELVSPLEIGSVENLNEQIIGQDQLDKLVGKVGQDLFDEGWSYRYYNLENMEAGLEYGPFMYIATFSYDGAPMENTDDFDFYERFKDLPISSVTYGGLGDATGPELE